MLRNAHWRFWFTVSLTAAIGCGARAPEVDTLGAPAGAECTGDSACASGACVAGGCVGSGASAGSSTDTSSDDGSGSSGDGSSSSGDSTTSLFQGSGSAGESLTSGCGPDTQDRCGGICEGGGEGSGETVTTIVRPPATLCFSGEEDPTPENPTAVIEQVIESVDGAAMVHLKVTFDPSFVDNTFGAEACCGWSTEGEAEMTAPAMEPVMPGMEMAGMMMKPKPGKGGHTFQDLVGSDHLELLLTDGGGATVMDFKIDYVSEDADSPCGFGSLGVLGGEGKVLLGEASAVLGVATSIDRNLNGCGYCYTEDSPATSEGWPANAETPDWDYRVVYEVWIALDAFGDAGFGQAYIENVHASPSKLATNTVEVFATPCPPEWDTPFCPPELVLEDGTCNTQMTECPPNYELYIKTEGQSLCVPIPFTNNPGMTPCPEGYELDAATEGRYCVPVEP